MYCEIRREVSSSELLCDLIVHLVLEMILDSILETKRWILIEGKIASSRAWCDLVNLNSFVYTQMECAQHYELDEE